MKIKNMNLEIIELEIKKIIQLFAKEKNLKIKTFFGKLGDENFPKGTNGAKANRGFCSPNKVLGRYEIYIRLDRSSRASIFQTLAHELAHVCKRELEKESYAVKHDALFWKIMDEKTFPFVEKNLSEEDQVNLLKLLNPTTNKDERIDRVYLEKKLNEVHFEVEKEKVDRIWKLVRQKTLDGELGEEAQVSTARQSKDKHRIIIYTTDYSLDITQRLEQLGINYRFYVK